MNDAPKLEIYFNGHGRVHRVDHFTAKSGKDIVTVILETDGRFPQLCPLKCFGRLADEVGSLKEGTVVRVKGRLGGRDWNGKVFGDNVAEVVEVVGGVGKQPAWNSPPDDEDPSLPF